MRKNNKYAERNPDYLTDEVRAYFDKHTSNVKLRWFLRTLKEMIPDSTGKILFDAEKLIKANKYKDKDLPAFLEKIFLEYLEKYNYKFNIENNKLKYFYTKGS